MIVFMHFDFSLYTTYIYHYGICQDAILTSRGVIGIHNSLIYLVFNPSNIQGRAEKRKQPAQKSPTTSLGLSNLEGQSWQKPMVFSFIFLDAHQ